MSASKPWVSQAVMKAMQALGRDGMTVTLAGVKAATELTAHQISPAATRLVKQGLLAQVLYSDNTDKPTPRRGLWTVTVAGQQCDAEALRNGPRGGFGRQRRPNHTPSLREQFWNLLRCKEKLSIPDALEVLLNPGDDVQLASINLQRYIRGLAKGGYIALLNAPRPGIGSNGHRRWLLIDDTGRQAPSLSVKGGGIYDHNTRSLRP